jgi:hypothetical protein
MVIAVAIFVVSPMLVSRVIGYRAAVSCVVVIVNTVLVIAVFMPAEIAGTRFSMDHLAPPNLRGSCLVGSEADWALRTMLAAYLWTRPR